MHYQFTAGDWVAFNDMNTVAHGEILYTLKDVIQDKLDLYTTSGPVPAHRVLEVRGRDGHREVFDRK